MFNNMKALIYKSVVVVTLIAASAFAGLSQTRSIEHDFSPFDAIEASNGFKVSTSASDSYGVKLTVDDALESYVECYVKAGTLHISLDEKSVPKDLKRQYRGRNSGDPTLVAVVYLPALKSLTLNDNSEFFNSSNFSGETFSLTLNGTSKISSLKVVAKVVNINLTRNSKLSGASITCEGDLAVNTDGKASVDMECAAENLLISASGSSELNLNGKIEKKVEETIAGSSKTNLTGSTETLVLNGKGMSAKIEAAGMKAGSAVISVSGTDVTVSPSDNIEFDLGKGSQVTYSGDPVVKIDKIQNATVIHQ